MKVGWRAGIYRKRAGSNVTRTIFRSPGSLRPGRSKRQSDAESLLYGIVLRICGRGAQVDYRFVEDLFSCVPILSLNASKPGRPCPCDAKRLPEMTCDGLEQQTNEGSFDIQRKQRGIDHRIAATMKAAASYCAVGAQLKQKRHSAVTDEAPLTLSDFVKKLWRQCFRIICSYPEREISFSISLRSGKPYVPMPYRIRIALFWQADRKSTLPGIVGL